MDRTRPRSRRGGLFYGWWIVWTAVVVTALSSGAVWGSVGVWLKTLELHFGWTRTQLTGAFALAQLESSIIGPVAGYYIDRLGPRRMILAGLVVVGGGFIVLSRTPNLVVFYLAFAIFMIGASTGTWLPMTTVLNRWFNRKKGTAIAISGEGNYIGGLLLVPALAWAVNPDHIGWSTTAFGLGILFVTLAVPVSLIMRERPEQYGLLPDGDDPGRPPGSPAAPGLPREGGRAAETAAGLTAREAMRTSAFWYITLGIAFSAMINQTLGVHLVPMLTDQGISLQKAAYVWSVIMGAGIVASLVAGYVGDRAPKNVAMAVSVGIQACAFAFAAHVHSFPMAALFAVFYGIGFGGRVPLSVAIRAEYFGPRAFATITGLSMAPMFLLQVVAPLFAAAMFDIRDSYVLPFAILTPLGLSGALFCLVARRPAARSAGGGTGGPGSAAGP
ncbi:MAG: MFS transporter [Dehalococcoidia bacterium]|nr:MFS transporter [Dehalococcoidia bacterium]